MAEKVAPARAVQKAAQGYTISSLIRPDIFYINPNFLAFVQRRLGEIACVQRLPCCCPCGQLLPVIQICLEWYAFISMQRGAHAHCAFVACLSRGLEKLDLVCHNGGRCCEHCISLIYRHIRSGRPRGPVNQNSSCKRNRVS